MANGIVWDDEAPVGGVAWDEEPAPRVPQVGGLEHVANKWSSTLLGGRPLRNFLGTAMVQGAKALGAGQPSVRLTPEAQAEAEKMGLPVNTESAIPGPVDTYRQIRDRSDARLDIGAEQNPWLDKVGLGLGIANSILLPTPKLLGGSGLTAATRAATRAEAAARAAAPGARGAGALLRSMLRGAGTGALAGGAQAAGESRADLTQGDLGGQLEDMAIGGAIGGAFGGAIPAAGAALRRVAEGIVRPNESAILLRSRGVPLTLGQMRPEGALSQVEESAQSVMGIGPGIAGQRGAAAKGWQNALLNEALAPGSAPLDHSRTLTQRMDDMARGFDEAYALPKAMEVAPQTSSGTSLPQALAEALDDPNAMATEETQKVVRKFLDNQLSLLPQLRKAEAGGKVPAETLMAIRSNIRKAAQAAGKAENYEREALLRNAEEVLTDSLNSQLPEEMAQLLQATDRRYSLFRTLEKAVARAGGKEEGFTPFQVESALKRGMNDSRFARGKGGGEFRDLIEASRNTIEGEVPKTGVRALTMGDPLRSAIAATGSYISNLPRVQPWFLGEAPLQRNLRGLMGLTPLTAAGRALPGTATRALLPDEPMPADAAERAAIAGFLASDKPDAEAQAEALRRRRR